MIIKLIKKFQFFVFLSLFVFQAVFASHQNEIYSLKRIFGNNSNINVKNQTAKTLAPNLINNLEKIVQQLIEKTKLDKPDIEILLGNSQESYNASASIQITTSKSITVKYINNQITKEKIKETKDTYRKIKIGENALTLLNNLELKAVIAHEIGHMIFNHLDEKEKNEHEADWKAIELIGKQNGFALITAINKLSIGSKILGILSANKSLFNINEHQAKEITGNLCNRIIKKYPTLKKIGFAKTHEKFSLLIQSALQKTLDKLNKNSIEINEIEKTVYKKLKKACLNGKKSLTESILDNYKNNIKNTNNLYSPTHPAPFKRQNWIIKCIQ